MNERQKILAFMTVYAGFAAGVGAAFGVVGVAVFCVVQALILLAILP